MMSFAIWHTVKSSRHPGAGRGPWANPRTDWFLQRSWVPAVVSKTRFQHAALARPNIFGTVWLKLLGRAMSKLRSDIV